MLKEDKLEPNQGEEKTQIVEHELTEGEQKEFRDGMELLAVTQLPGWKIIHEIWDRIANNAGPDPRGMKPDEYQLACLAAWAASNNAKEFLQTVGEMISRADYLDKVNKGEIKTRNMKI